MISITNGPTVPLDDYILHMVLQRGRVISVPKKPLYVEVIDMSDVRPLKFKMSLVDASFISDMHPDFDTKGLVATWRLHGTSGLLKMIKAFDSTCPIKIKEFLLDPQSASFVLDKYKKVL